ncbi:MAG: hypothetical protein JJ909_04750, partial [Roseivirga sp.]|nr:hypothetical protein [Roseivirga sp.]
MKKVLFINYFLEPNLVVGAKRVSYWHRCIKESSGGKYTSDVVYADIKGEYTYEDSGKGICIPDTKRGWVKRLFKKDQGASWYYDLKSALKELSLEQYDFIVVSGSPFIQMLLIGKMKKLSNAVIIVDFRDPFAIIPRFKQNKLKLTLKKFIENRILNLADHLITINDYCLEVILRGSQRVDYTLINNGFDDQVLKLTSDRPEEELKLAKNVRLALCGKLDVSRNPEKLFQALNSNSDNSIDIDYFGSSHIETQGVEVKKHGTMAYSTFIKNLMNFHLGVIITSGHGFEATTKIFDYLAAG